MTIVNSSHRDLALNVSRLFKTFYLYIFYRPKQAQKLYRLRNQRRTRAHPLDTPLTKMPKKYCTTNPENYNTNILKTEK